MKVKLQTLLPLFAFTSISAIVTTPLIANANECQSAISYGEQKINGFDYASIVLPTHTYAHGYSEYPEGRSKGLSFAINGRGADDIMSSPLFMVDIATRIISSCNSIGVVDFAVYEKSPGEPYHIFSYKKFGIMWNGLIGIFKCDLPAYNRWGYVTDRKCITEPLVANANECQSAISYGEQKINGVNNANLVYSETRAHQYSEYPAGRSKSHIFAINGRGVDDIMSSALFMTDIATHIISSCNSIGVVSFAPYASDWFNTIGIMWNGQIEFFECISPGRNIDADWGYYVCT